MELGIIRIVFAKIIQTEYYCHLPSFPGGRAWPCLTQCHMGLLEKPFSTAFFWDVWLVFDGICVPQISHDILYDIDLTNYSDKPPSSSGKDLGANKVESAPSSMHSMSENCISHPENWNKTVGRRCRFPHISPNMYNPVWFIRLGQSYQIGMD